MWDHRGGCCPVEQAKDGLATIFQARKGHKDAKGQSSESSDELRLRAWAMSKMMWCGQWYPSQAGAACYRCRRVFRRVWRSLRDANGEHTHCDKLFEERSSAHRSSASAHCIRSEKTLNWRYKRIHRLFMMISSPLETSPQDDTRVQPAQTSFCTNGRHTYTVSAVQHKFWNWLDN